MAIIISTKSESPKKVTESGVEDEAYMQKYVSEFSDCLPLEEIEEDGKHGLLIIGREFLVGSNRIDILGIDHHGNLYIIETKLYKNPDKREVVAQILDYGAALWAIYKNPELFIEDIEFFLRKNNKKDLKLSLLEQYSRSVEGWSEEEVIRAIENLKENISSGDIHYLVLMDSLTETLKNLITFLNAKSKFSIYIVEMKFYRHDGLEIVIPKLFGTEIQKEIINSQAKDTKYIWDEKKFTEEASRVLKPEQFLAVQKVCDLSKSSGLGIEWKTLSFQGGGKLNVGIPELGINRLFSLGTDGSIILDFRQTEKADAKRQFRNELRLALLNAQFANSTELLEGGKITLPIEKWVSQYPIFISVIENLLNNLVNSAG